jgi:hypothetical protein
MNQFEFLQTTLRAYHHDLRWQSDELIVVAHYLLLSNGFRVYQDDNVNVSFFKKNIDLFFVDATT